MIIRNRKINPSAKEIMLSVSFTSADVRRWMEDYANIICRRVCDQTREEAIEETRSRRETEQALRYWLEHCPSVFLNYEAPYREQLSAWGFTQAVTLGYLVQSAARPDEYLLSDKFFSLIH